MIATIRGTILSIGKDHVVVETTGGVGYEVKTSKHQNTRTSIGGEVFLYTYLKVSDSAMELYGFETVEERAFFTLLLSVSGVGPKTALHILSLGSLEHIESAIVRGDVQYLTAVQGLGKKTAERVVVELKSKVKSGDAKPGQSADGGMLGEVMDGLVALGYTREEAKQAALAVDLTGLSTEDALRTVLKGLSR